MAHLKRWTVVVAQLVKLQRSVVRIQALTKIYIERLLSTVLKKTKMRL